MLLEKLVQEYRFFIDTCSWMHPGVKDFFLSQLAPSLKKHKKKIYVPKRVIEEVEKLQNQRNKTRKNRAAQAAHLINHFLKGDLLSVRGEKGDPFADNVFHFVFSKFRTQYNLVLLTQDMALARDIDALNYSTSVYSSKKILVVKFGKNGNLEKWGFNNSSLSQEKKRADCMSKEKVEKKVSGKVFRTFKEPRKINDRPLRVRMIPKENDFVTAEGFGQLRLQKVLGRGGEGVIYRTSSGHVCKVYHESSITELRRQKIALMTESPVNVTGICWPQALAENKHGEFVGYVMSQAQGIPMQRCMFIKPLLEKNFPRWKRTDLVQLSITWLEKIIALHQKNVLIGDINPLNFLVKSPTEIFFVDTDSYQIEDFPCMVGMSNFTAPEIQGKKFSTFLRSAKHEEFALASLLFMILMPGKPPYSQQGGGDPISNIKNGQFSYPLGGKSNKKTPDGPWRFIWSHFPYKTKEAFYQCFEKGKRLSAKEWLQIIENYFFSLQKGYLDPSGESNKIFPTTFKGVSQHAREKYGLEEIKQVSFVCDHCHKSFQVDQKRAKQISSHAQKCCRDCAIVFQQMRQTGEMKCCIVCDSQFLFSNSEKQFFESKGFEPPKKCPDCRKSSKQSISQRSSTGKKSNARGTRSTGRSQTSPRPAPQPRSFWDEMVDIWNAFWQ